MRGNQADVEERINEVKGQIQMKDPIVLPVQFCSQDEREHFDGLRCGVKSSVDCLQLGC